MNNLKRVQFVTGNYGNLQGLRWVAWGILCLAVAAEDGGWLDTAVLLAVMIPAALIVFFGTTLYYRRVYGEVNAEASKGKDWPFGLALTGAGVVSLFIDRELNPPLYAAPLLFATVMAWMSWQGRPFRWHYLLAAVVVITADLLLLWPEAGAILSAMRPGVFLWILIGFSLITTGLFDHLLLTRTFQPIEEETV